MNKHTILNIRLVTTLKYTKFHLAARLVKPGMFAVEVEVIAGSYISEVGSRAGGSFRRLQEYSDVLTRDCYM